MESPFEWYKNPDIAELKLNSNKQTPMQNNVFSVKPIEFREYRMQFFMEIVAFAKWEKNYLSNQSKENKAISLD
jgi:hypothetical protein